MVMLDRPLFLFAPGAGAPSTHPWMQRWRRYLLEIGDVVLFDYPYMLAGKRRPDPLLVLIAAHRSALAAANSPRTRRVVLVGKSMGSRIGCHVALEEPVAALVCLGFPLCAAGDATRLRDKVLKDLTTPILFVQGTRDSLCPLDLFARVQKEMQAPASLHIVEGGDHSLAVSKRVLEQAAETQEQVDRKILAAVTKFIRSSLP
jgi:predicted alpha/beta-hydrolase family hydrolase